jgi:alpha-tubulin suppressor-like RCC1 family protein
MPIDDISYKFTENGIVYDFYDVFVPAENFRQPSLFTWGTNGDVQLGTNGGGTKSTPVTTFAGGTTWKSVSCGTFHTAAIKTDGTLWNWGNNAGSLGTNDTAKRSTPVTTFAGGTNWKQVSSGYAHTAAIKTDGSLWVWGFNNNAQLGDFSTSQRNVPVTTFAGGTTWKQVSCGESHTAAIKTDGSLWIWGRNHNAQLGINNTDQKNTPVTTFAGGNDWKQVACGFEASHTAAIKTDGSLWTWGSNSLGQLGTNDTSTRSTPVTTFAGGNNWKYILCGDRRTAAIKTDGSLWTWGLDNGGQLGTNGSGNRSTPVTTFAGGNNWKSVGGRGGSAAAIKTDGTLWVWGFNNTAQLGTNNTTQQNAPVTTFAGGNNWKSADGNGTGFTIAIKYSPDP